VLHLPEESGNPFIRLMIGHVNYSLGKPSIAVLPFDLVGGGREEKFFADGLHVEMISALVNIRSLAVACRDSPIAYASHAVDLRQIGRQLEVDYLIKGSIRKVDECVRVAVALINAITGHHIFSHSYEAIVSDVFAVQEEIATKFSALVEPHIYAVEGRQPAVRGRRTAGYSRSRSN
jgi:adenylate cyclase